MSGGDVDLVKSGVLDMDKSLTVGNALDGNKFFKSKKWEAKKDEQGRRFVVFTGELIQKVATASHYNVVMTFVINSDNTFQSAREEFNEITADGKSVDQGYRIFSRNQLLTLVYENRLNPYDDLYAGAQNAFNDRRLDEERQKDYARISKGAK
jgi:hypothetical protein